MRRLSSLFLLLVVLVGATALADVLFRNGSTKLGAVHSVACGVGVVCTRDAGVGIINAIPPVPVDAGFDGGHCVYGGLVYGRNGLEIASSSTCSGSTTGVGVEQLVGGNYIVLDAGNGPVSINWRHGLNCQYDQRLTTNGVGGMACQTNPASAGAETLNISADVVVAFPGTLNNTAILKYTRAQKPSATSAITCSWGGAAAATDGGSKGVVMFLWDLTNISVFQGYDGGTQHFDELCSCRVGPCHGNDNGGLNITIAGSCACPLSVDAGTVVGFGFSTTHGDGGVASDCSTLPTELHCTVN